MNKINQLIFGLVITSFALWSSLLLAHDPDKTKYPLTISCSLSQEHTTIKVAFNAATLKDLYKNGNPLKLQSWPKYYDALKGKIKPHHKQGYVFADRRLGEHPFEIYTIHFYEAPVGWQFFRSLEETIGTAGLAPFVDISIQHNSFNADDKFTRLLVSELKTGEIPTSLSPVARMLSCGDNVTKVASYIKSGTWCPSPAYQFATFCDERGQKSELTIAGDIMIDQQVNYVDPDGLAITGIHLDNLLPFKEQFEKLGWWPVNFQLVLGLKLLCHCQADSPNLCCGGFDLAAQDRQLVNFLVSVTSVLDETADSMAILSGYNPIEPQGVDADVLRFNQITPRFEAKIFRNEFGEFYGIVIKKRQALPADDEKQADL